MPRAGSAPTPGWVVAVGLAMRFCLFAVMLTVMLTWGGIFHISGMVSQNLWAFPAPTAEGTDR